MVENNLLSLSYGKLKRKDIETTEGLLPKSFETYNIINEDDIVLRLIDLQNDHKSLRVGRAEERGIVTSAYVTITPYNTNDSKFLYYVLHTYDLIKGFYGMGNGVRQGLNWQEIKHLQIPWPNATTRQQITDYLDKELLKVNNTIFTMQNFLQVTKQYKESLIYGVVTGKQKTQ
jgi:type I restriction enzyme S subunit